MIASEKIILERGGVMQFDPQDKSQPTMVPDPWVDGGLGGHSLSWRDKRKVNVFYQCPDVWGRRLFRATKEITDVCFRIGVLVPIAGKSSFVLIIAQFT